MLFSNTHSDNICNDVVNNENISYYIYGLSMHILTDTFAHSSYKLQNGKWKRIIHDDGADKVTVVPNRLKCVVFIVK